MIDPIIARAKIEIASDQALIRKLTSDDAKPGVLADPKTKARIASLKRLIAANRALLERLKG